jgi:hypothetical protein
MSTYVFKDGQQEGPFENAEIHARLSEGTLSAGDLGWREGLADWTPLGTLFPEQVPNPQLKVKVPAAPVLAASPQAGPVPALTDPTNPMRKFVIAQIKEGKLLPEVVDKLIEMGIEETAARPFATKLFSENAGLADSAQFKRSLNMSVLLPAVAASGGAGVLGGVLWGLVIVFTGMEIKILAWGLGALCGFAALWAGRQIRGPVLQATAMLSTLVGIFLGKYIGFYNYFREAVEEEGGVQASFFSSEFFAFFLKNFILLFGGKAGVVFFCLALATAWKIPSESIVHD